jgi:hypothetical protein
MTRRQTTIAVDEELLGAVARAAEDDGVAPDELVEEALRRYFGLRGLAVMDELASSREASGPHLTDDEAMEMAVAEIKAQRAERAAQRNAS